MNITKKIEEIRLQPDNVRLRWVWGSVIFSMLIIFAIWLLSITLMFKGENGNPSQNSANIQTDAAPQQAASLKDYTEDKPLTVGAEGVSSSRKNNATQTTPMPNSESTDTASSSVNTTNQSSSYTGLSK